MSARKGRAAVIAACMVALPVAFLALRKPIIDEWRIRTLRDETLSRDRRAAAFRALVEARCYRALPELARWVSEEEPWNTTGPLWEALASLGGPQAWPYWRTLVEGDPYDVGWWAWSCIARGGMPEDEKVKAFRRALSRSPDWTTNAAVEGADWLGSRAVEPLLHAEGLTPVGLQCFFELGPLALDARSSVVEALERAEVPWREGVAFLEDTGCDTTSELETALLSNNSDLACWAAVKLRERNPSHRRAAEALIASVWKVRDWPELDFTSEMEAIAAWCPEAFEALMLSEGEARRWAFEAIKVVGIRAIPILFRAMLRGSAAARAEALRQLDMRCGWVELLLAFPAEGTMSPAPQEETAASAVPELSPFALGEIRDPLQERIDATRALGQMGSDGAARLAGMLEVELDRGVREAALESLAQLGPDASGALGAVLRALRSRPAKTQVLAARVLVRMGAPAVPALIAALAEPHQDVRCLAVYALGRIEPATPAMEEALRAGLGDPSPLVRATAERALARLADR